MSNGAAGTGGTAGNAGSAGANGFWGGLKHNGAIFYSMGGAGGGGSSSTGTNGVAGGNAPIINPIITNIPTTIISAIEHSLSFFI